MAERKNLCTENFSRALGLKDEPRKFVEFISRMLGSSGHDLTVWANTFNTETELKEAIEEVLNKGGVCDEWVFLWTACGESAVANHSNKGSAYSAATGYHGSDDSCADDDQGPATEGPIRLIGEKIEELVSNIAGTISSTVVSGGSKFLVIHGGPMSGKTTFLKRLSEVLLEERSIISANYRELSNPDVMSVFNATRVVMLDDADMEALSQAMETQMIKYYRSRSHVLLFTCRDISKLQNLINACDGHVYKLPQPSDDEVVSILSSLAIRGYNVSLGTARKILNLLNAFGVNERLPKAIDTMRMLLYPRLHSDFRKGTVRDTCQEVDFRRAAIEDAVSHVIGIKVMPATDETEKRLIEDITSRVKGQDKVVREIVPTLTSIAAGLTDPSKPAGVLMFYGPTGCGKTELGKVIADVLFNGVVHKEDMNTYSEKHSVSRITGAPPGYIGYGETPAMIEFIDSHARGVLILDEVEKAHETVLDHVMELTDTGMIRDTKGKLHDARGFLVILTSNVTFEAVKSRVLGFEQSEDEVEDDPRGELQATKRFKPEFLGRVHVITKFNPLGDNVIREIAKIMLDDLEERLMSVGVRMTYKDKLLKEIIESFDTKSGARSMKNYTETHIKNKVLEQSRK